MDYSLLHPLTRRNQEQTLIMIFPLTLFYSTFFFPNDNLGNLGHPDQKLLNFYFLLQNRFCHPKLELINLSAFWLHSHFHSELNTTEANFDCLASRSCHFPDMTIQQSYFFFHNTESFYISFISSDSFFLKSLRKIERAAVRIP